MSGRDMIRHLADLIAIGVSGWFILLNPLPGWNNPVMNGIALFVIVASIWRIVQRFRGRE